MNKKWETYEEVAAYLLNRFSDEFGVDFFEGKQNVRGHRSGTSWEIDAKGVKSPNGGFIVVECKDWKGKQPQSIIGSLAYTIIDTGAIGGLIISPIGVQIGGQMIAAAENIFEVRLDENSTRDQFAMHFLNKLLVGVSAPLSLQAVVTVEVEKAGHVGKTERDRPNSE